MAKCCGCVVSLKAALDSAMSLELGPKGLLVFEDYTKGNTSSSNLAQRKGIPGWSDGNISLQIHLTFIVLFFSYM